MPRRLLYVVRHGEQADPDPRVDDPAAGLSGAGERQASLLGERLRGVRFDAIHHSPLRRAAQTAAILAGYLPGVPVHSEALVGDYVPYVPRPDDGDHVDHRWFARFSAEDAAEGARLAAAALDRFARAPDEDGVELLVTHNWPAAWFVRHSLDAPPWRWPTIHHYHCGLTVIAYRPERPATLLSYNDVGHLPLLLRGAGVPPELRV